MANFTEDLFDIFEEVEDVVEVIPPPVKQKPDVNVSLDER